MKSTLVLESTVRIMRGLNEAYGHNPDLYESTTAKAGARVGHAKIAKARIERAFCEPQTIVDMIILHHTSQFAVY